jgi:hypothetical protein
MSFALNEIGLPMNEIGASPLSSPEAQRGPCCGFCRRKWALNSRKTGSQGIR